MLPTNAFILNFRPGVCCGSQSRGRHNTIGLAAIMDELLERFKAALEGGILGFFAGNRAYRAKENQRLRRGY